MIPKIDLKYKRDWRNCSVKEAKKFAKRKLNEGLFHCIEFDFEVSAYTGRLKEFLTPAQRDEFVYFMNQKEREKDYLCWGSDKGVM